MVKSTYQLCYAVSSYNTYHKKDTYKFNTNYIEYTHFEYT